MENQNTDQRTRDTRGSHIVLGVLTGTVVGVALGLYFAPSLTLALRRVDEWAKAAQSGASEQYRRASVRKGDAIDQLNQVGQKVRDEAADMVIRGAREVERVATAVKTV